MSEAEQVNNLLTELYGPLRHPVTDEGLKKVPYYLTIGQNPRVGMAVLSVIQRPSVCTGIINDVVITESRRRQGYGRTLMASVLWLAYELGLDDVQLSTANHRTEAMRFYEALGFEKVPVTTYRKRL